MFIVFYIGQIGKQIFCFYKYKLILGRIRYFFIDVFLFIIKIRVKFFHHVLNTLFEKIESIFIMKIKGGSVDIGFFAYFFYGDIFKIFFCYQSYQGCVHFFCRFEVFAFRFIHTCPPLILKIFYSLLISFASCIISKEYFFFPFFSNFV